jgi:hypothetical protein
VRGCLKARARRSLFTVVAVFLVVAAVGVAGYYWFFSPVIIEGVVDHKAVTGTKDATTYSVLLNADWGIVVEDEDYGGWFSDGEMNAIVNVSLEDELRREYSEVFYFVSVRVSSEDPINNLEEGETLAYFVSRDGFNKLSIGDNVRFEVDRFKTATIKGLAVIGIITV